MAAMPQSQRERLIDRLHHYFASERMPRLAMLVVLTLTASVGFLSSRGLLAAGLDLMAVRYALAGLAGWLAFILLVRIWVKIEQSLIDPERAISNNATSRHASQDDQQTLDTAGEAAIRTLDVVGVDSGEEFGCLVSLAISVFAFVFVVCIGSVFSLIASAPILLAEAFLDIAVAGIFANKLKLHDAQWWATGVIRRTWKAALSIVIMLSVAGFALQTSKPGIRTLGEFFGS